MNIQIDKNAKVPLYVQLVGGIREKIISGELPYGSRLPSERKLAEILGIHRNTVVKAYGELKADGLISSRIGAFYTVTAPEDSVRFGEGSFVKAGASSNRNDWGKSVNWAGMIRKEHLDMERGFDKLFQHADDGMRYSMGNGIAALNVYDRKKVADDLKGLVEASGKHGLFCPPLGDRGLAKSLMPFLSMKGIKASGAEILIMQETNQALNYLVEMLVNPGDTIITEESVSPDVQRTLRLVGGELSAAPVDENGMNPNALEELIKRKKPRLIFVNSSFHDPMGVVLSTERRRSIMELSKRYRIPLIEEDAGSELVYEGPDITPLKAFDDCGNVIYMYSFSLSFVPGLSLAFVVANRKICESMGYLSQMRQDGPDWMTQKLAAKYLADGTYFEALRRFRKIYRERQEVVCAKLDAMRELGVSYMKPRGGVYIWCELPKGVDSKELANKAYAKGLMVVPGHFFYPNKKEGRNHIRICYSYESAERLNGGMEVLKEVLCELLAEKAADR